MKKCKNCGCKNTDESNFCENCGQRLTPDNVVQPKEKPVKEPGKKGNGGIIALIIIGVVVIVAAILVTGVLLLRSRLPAVFQKILPGGQVQELPEEFTDQEEMEREEGQEPEELPEEPGDSPQVEVPKQEEYSDVDINGVDNAYIIVNGTLAEQGGQMFLVLPGPQSAAVECNGQILRKEDVAQLILIGEVKGDVGAMVSIKGKLSADGADNFALEIVSMEVTKAPVVPADNPSEIHRYEVIQGDVTWQEAYEESIRRGGYLARINSEEEFQTVLQVITEADMQKVHFFLGGMRKEDGREYYWVDENGALMEPMLNPEGTSWAAGHWMENEPSYTSEEDIEMYLNLVYYKENWVLNDVPIDITMYYSGRTGFIIEYEN